MQYSLFVSVGSGSDFFFLTVGSGSDFFLEGRIHAFYTAPCMVPDEILILDGNSEQVAKA